MSVRKGIYPKVNGKICNCQSCLVSVKNKLYSVEEMYCVVGGKYQHIFPTPDVITFNVIGTYDETVYQAEAGMTWNEFIESAYNPTDDSYGDKVFTIRYDEDPGVDYYGGSLFDSNSNLVYINRGIEDGEYYYTDNSVNCEHNWSATGYSWNSDCSACTASFVCTTCGATNNNVDADYIEVNSNYGTYEDYIAYFILDGKTWSDVCEGYHCTSCWSRVTSCGSCDQYYCPNGCFSDCECGSTDECDHSSGNTYNENVTDATCQYEGSWDVHCADCGAFLERQSSDSPVDCSYGDDGKCIWCGNESCTHSNYGEGNMDDPTCTEAGVLTYVCNDCGHTWDEEIPANGHSWNGHGNCEICGDPCPGHEFDEDGYCTICGIHMDEA